LGLYNQDLKGQRQNEEWGEKPIEHLFCEKSLGNSVPEKEQGPQTTSKTGVKFTISAKEKKLVTTVEKT